MNSANEELAEKFFEQLARADDGFSVVADYFGRGVFNKVTVVADRIAGGGLLKKNAPAVPAFGADPMRPGGGSGSGSAQTLPNYSEGRLRATEGRLPTTGVSGPSEGRMRGSEGWQGAPAAAPSEARLRKDEKSVGVKQVGPRGEGRLRLHEGAGVTLLKDIRANPENPNSLMANLDQQSHSTTSQPTRQRPSLNPDKPSFVRPSTTGVRVPARVSVESSAKPTAIAFRSGSTARAVAVNGRLFGMAREIRRHDGFPVRGSLLSKFHTFNRGFTPTSSSCKTGNGSFQSK